MLQSISKLMVFALFALNAHAKPLMTQVYSTSSPWDIATVQLNEIADLAPPAVIKVENDCSALNSTHPRGLEDVDWSTVVAVGEKIWKIVEANRPVVTITTPVAYALPRGLNCWADLEHWQAPMVKTFEVAYTNGFGSEVVKFRFRLQFNYGGGKGDVGKYIANATVLPAELNVAWGYNFDASVNVAQAVNLGTIANPLAGLGLDLKWTVKTVIKESQNSFGFFIQGDGVSTAVN